MVPVVGYLARHGDRIVRVSRGGLSTCDIGGFLTGKTTPFRGPPSSRGHRRGGGAAERGGWRWRLMRMGVVEVAVDYWRRLVDR